MYTRNRTGAKFLLVAILSIFLMPISSGALVDVYINDKDMLNSEDVIIFDGGRNLKLNIKLYEDFKYDSNNENLSIRSISIGVTFMSDTDNRGTTSGIPSIVDQGNNNVEYEEYESVFRASDPIFKGYDGDIQFSIIMKNASKVIIREEIFEITLQSSSAESSSGGGFSIPELPDSIANNLVVIVGGLVVFIVLSIVVYTFVLAPEDTTADLYRPKEAINPLSKSLTGVGYDSELPSESKLKRLEDSNSDSEEEEEDDDDDYVDIDDDDGNDDFDESKLLAELTGGSQLKSAAVEENEKPEPKKKVKRKVAKKAVTKKVVRKAAPKATPKTSAKEPEVNMGKGIKGITCPSCETVHNVDENTVKFICSCGRRIRV